MKTRNLTYLGGLAALAVAVGVLGARVEVDTSTDALALDSNSSIVATCNGGTAPVPTAAVPDIAIAITTGSSQGAVPTASVSTSIGSGTGINGETGTFTHLTFDFLESTNNRTFKLSHNAPKMKLYGLQCHNEKSASLGTTGTDAGTAAASNYDVYASNLVDDFSTAGKKIDSTTPKMLYGASGVISTDYVTDGSGTLTDDSATADGEVLFGSMSATDAAADNLWRLNHKIAIFDVSTANYGTLTESITFTFTQVD